MNKNVTTALTATDMKILIEAMDAWINKGTAGEIMAMMLGGMMAEDKDAFLIAQEEKQAKRDEEIKDRQRAATLLKAKLIMLEEELSGSELFAAATAQGKEA